MLKSLLLAFCLSLGLAASAADAPGLRFGVALERVVRRGIAGADDVQPDQPPVDMAAIADPDDRLLAEVAALAVVDGGVEADLHREVFGRDLRAEARLDRDDAR